MRLTQDVSPCIVNPSTGYLSVVQGMTLKAGTNVFFMQPWPRECNAPVQHICVAIEHCGGIGPTQMFWVPKSSVAGTSNVR